MMKLQAKIDVLGVLKLREKIRQRVVDRLIIYLMGSQWYLDAQGSQHFRGLQKKRFYQESDISFNNFFKPQSGVYCVGHANRLYAGSS